ncbi:MAG TPA: GspH/FimT family pseudopilin [Thermoanaerobaculia bacterium]
MSLFAPRGPRGPGIPSRAGFTLVELLTGLAVTSWLLVMSVEGFARLEESVAIRSAVHETTVAFYRARSWAIARNRNVGLKFRKNGPRHEWTVYADGNGNGVLSSEINSGVDPPLGVYVPWSRNDVVPSIMTGIRVPDPSSPGSYLDRIEDPIRFNNSDICSFSGMGESTPGSVYLWDGRDRMAVVRIYGASARVRTLYYRRGEKGWTR